MKPCGPYSRIVALPLHTTEADEGVVDATDEAVGPLQNGHSTLNDPLMDCENVLASASI